MQPFLTTYTPIPDHKEYRVREPITVEFATYAPIELPSDLKTQAVSVPTSNNEDAVWGFLIARYTRNQTAGIMGNLQQEHNFQTSGDGLAQWIGGRKARLMALPNPHSLDTQLNFIITEMKERGIELPDDVVGATIMFQNKFEGCGKCMQSRRIQFAQAILARH